MHTDITEIFRLLEQALSQQVFATWIKPLNIELKNDNITVSAKNKFIRDWVQNNYSEIIQQIVKHIYSKDIKIIYEIKESKHSNKNEINVSKNSNDKKKFDKKENVKQLNNNDSKLNSKYTFDFFVSGNSNQFAHAAAYAVAQSPASAYNPLFIYGGVGLGKTHLINAIGNEIIKNSNKNVIYYTSEDFMNELINNIRIGKMDEFRQKFRNVDVLLIDDVQFLAGKERTQEEFFHTFNSLYDNQKQIVVTSDKFPKEIPGIEERLRSRFEWGLIADIQPPDLETKEAILRLKSEQNNMRLNEEIITYLASSFSGNIRVLEGYLVRIAAFYSLTNAEITLDSVKEMLKDVISDSKKEVSIEKIQKVVCNYYNIKLTDLKSQKRLKNLVLPRQIAMYISRQITSASFPEIGAKFGGKDHSTIIYGIKKIQEMIRMDGELEKKINELLEIIDNN